jgi:hypothetical protein
MPAPLDVWVPAVYLGVAYVVLPAYCILKYHSRGAKAMRYRAFYMEDSHGMYMRKGPRTDTGKEGADKLQSYEVVGRNIEI